MCTGSVRDAYAQSSSSGGANIEVDAAALFELGISLVEARRFEEALHAFDLAHRLAPHPDVLFNLGLVQFELKLMSGATVSLTEYLATTPDVDTPQRKEARRVLDVVSTAHQEPHPASDVVVEAVPGGEPAVSVRREAEVMPRHSTRPATSPNAVAPSNTAVYTLLATGVVMLVGGGLLFWWSDQDAQEAKQRMTSLEAPEGVIKSQDQLRMALSYERDMSRLEARLETSATLDWVALATAGVGLFATGTGAYLGYRGGQNTPPVGSMPRQIAWRVTW